MKTKDFVCVEMMHTGARRIYEETKDMSEAEELAYWQTRRETARQRCPRLRQTENAPKARL